ncbi:MAG: cbb3-type cytochrome c oxidase subunit I [Chloroflexi bacterium]|nr:cbb3-type cytochrome c oxidase subunit I [Chloroflexota bacterium]
MAGSRRQQMDISPLWLQAAVLLFVVGFAVLLFVAVLTQRDQPPIPGRVVSETGETLFTGDDVMSGQHVFQKYGLMEYGTFFGHGAYLGPDFTADYLHRQAEMMVAFYANRPGYTDVAALDQMKRELRDNKYDPATDTLTFSAAQTQAFRSLVPVYTSLFSDPNGRGGLPPRLIVDENELSRLTSFFAWGAWAAATRRPGETYSYTNDWPPDPLVGSGPTYEALIWSMLSIIALLSGVGIVLYLFGRYDWLGWRGGEERALVRFHLPGEVPLTPSQKSTVWFFLVMALLFLAQTLVGGLTAHYRAEPGAFFGINLAQVLPYNLTRIWHLQLAIFWVATSYVAAGIFMTPLIAGREPRGQRWLSYALLVALAIVVVGSLLGEAAGIRNLLGPLWYLLGNQGWEYLDLGRLWQILLTVGLFLWAFIIFRGLRGRLAHEHIGNMPYLFFYASLSIPVFYAVGLLAGPSTTFTVTEFWRFWVVHLWVEDFLELFTTATVAYAFVLLGIVSARTGTRVIYLSAILYSIGGVIGTLHHMYFNGTPVIGLSLGAFFSAVEVIPLVLLTFEAWSFLHAGGLVGRSAREFPHWWAVWFLVAVGFWNFLGAGVFGFLINLPIVSYYEIGTNLTANHGHTAMFGVYGMLAVALMLFGLRYLMPADRWSDRAAGISFFSLNVGLIWMAFFNLFPVGLIQIADSFQNGYYHARELTFVLSPLINVLEWARLPGDILFIIGGVLPLVYLSLQAIVHPRGGGVIPEEQEFADRTLFTEIEE